MKDKRIIYFPAIVGFPTLAILGSGSIETLALGAISITLLALFLYTIMLMGNTESTEAKDSMVTREIRKYGEPDKEFSKPYSSFPNQESSGDEDILDEELENHEKDKNHQKRDQIHLTSNKSFENISYNLKNNSSQNKENNLEPAGIKNFRVDRFKKETLGPIVKEFIQELPNRTKIDNSLFTVFEKENFMEFLIQRGNLFINCDMDAYLEADPTIITNLMQRIHIRSENGKIIYIPISTPHRIYGAIMMETLSSFTDQDLLIFQSEADRFAFEWEARNEYELAIMDPRTLVYNRNHFKTILREKFHATELTSLFLLEIAGSDDREEFIAFLAEMLPTSIFRIKESTLSFFLTATEVEDLGEHLNKTLKLMDENGFYSEFVLGYSKREANFIDPSQWEENAFIQLNLAKRKSHKLSA
ncbi:hypothetical protein [Leptospira sp. GIMC2001]|uniref:hypothetical protein n=1 Tax=Leptospira sp. GIMC2001 TaxID=1513297 RepID=UPI00234B3F67|nr:hypothetical protein [Leptospira sp. GIMC2001]WCL50214.1 hypothetical protein O4O04_05175 [Leptospira sp. GIMC2001]